MDMDEMRDGEDEGREGENEGGNGYEIEKDKPGFRTWRGIRYFYAHPGRFWFAVFFGIGIALCFIPPMAPVILPLLLLSKFIFTSVGLIIASALIAFISGFLFSQLVAITNAFFHIGEYFREGIRLFEKGIRRLLYWGVVVPIMIIPWVLGWIPVVCNFLIETGKAFVFDSKRSSWIKYPLIFVASLFSIIPYTLWALTYVSSILLFGIEGLVGFILAGTSVLLQAVGKIGQVFIQCAFYISHNSKNEPRINLPTPIIIALHFLLALIVFPFACLVKLGLLIGQVFERMVAGLAWAGQIIAGKQTEEVLKEEEKPYVYKHAIILFLEWDASPLRKGADSNYPADKGGIDTLPRDIIDAVEQPIKSQIALFLTQEDRDIPKAPSSSLSR